MRHLLAAVATATFMVFANPAAQAASALSDFTGSISEDQIAFTKGGKGWKGGKHGGGWGDKGGRHWRGGGPPPWAPAHGWRRKHRW